METPEADRHGYVFNPCRSLRSDPRGLPRGQVGRTFSAIGKTAGIKVKTETGKDGQPVVKFASAHDLRRSFGLRWASRVMPQVLMELMRHESIDTTVRYYVGRNAQSTAAVLWAAHEAANGNTSGNSGQKNKNQPEPAVSSTASPD
jgi:integrase